MGVREKVANKRLIDANALWCKLEDEPWYYNVDRDEIALPLVNDAPTVDAVEVVRYRECKHHKDTSVTEYEHCCLTGQTVGYDDFCSYGERKGGNVLCE